MLEEDFPFAAPEDVKAMQAEPERALESPFVDTTQETPWVSAEDDEPIHANEGAFLREYDEGEGVEDFHESAAEFEAFDEDELEALEAMDLESRHEESIDDSEGDDAAAAHEARDSGPLSEAFAESFTDQVEEFDAEATIGLREAELEDEDELTLEAFRPWEDDETTEDETLEERQAAASAGRSRDFKLELELSYGVEKTVGGAPRGFPFITDPTDRLAEGTVVTTHTKSSDGFEVVMDGPRMEIETRRISLEEPAELDRIVGNILGFVQDLRRACGRQGPRTVPASAQAGKVRDIHLPVFADPDFVAFPIKDSRKQLTWFRRSCRIGASPQCTIDVPLESVIAFVDEIRNSQRRGRSQRWTGAGGARAGLRSDALYHARDAVIKSFRAHSKAGRATNLELTRRLAGFLILIVQYLRTSEMRYHKPDRLNDASFVRPDAGSRDHEQFPKAYVPLVVHTHFHVLFHDILSAAERALFMRLYGDAGVRQNLFDLALDSPGAKAGSAQLFPARTRAIQQRDFGAVLTWDQLVDSAIDPSKPIRDTSGTPSLPTPLATASKGVAKTGPAAARVNGVRLEMRRMGYRWWEPDEWRSMSRRLYRMARKLNGIS